MTDFTKEELEDISICVSGAMESSHILEIEYKLLYEKIQSMIDNYPKDIVGYARNRQKYIKCDHAWEPLEFAKDAPVRPMNICTKCGGLHYD